MSAQPDTQNGLLEHLTKLSSEIHETNRLLLEQQTILIRQAASAPLQFEKLVNHLEQRLKQHQQQIDRQFAFQQKEMNYKFSQVDKQFELQREEMNRRSTEVDKRLDLMRTEMDRRFDEVDKRFERVDKRFDLMQTEMDRRFTQVDKRLDNHTKLMIAGISFLSLLITLFKFLF